jgi:hypothetical protein
MPLSAPPLSANNSTSDETQTRPLRIAIAIFVLAKNKPSRLGAREFDCSSDSARLKRPTDPKPCLSRLHSVSRRARRQRVGSPGAPPDWLKYLPGTRNLRRSTKNEGFGSFSHNQSPSGWCGLWLFPSLNLAGQTIHSRNKQCQFSSLQSRA